MDSTKDESSMYYSFNDTVKTLENENMENEENESISIEILEDAITVKSSLLKSPLRAPNNVFSSSTPTKHNNIPKPANLRKSVLQDLTNAFAITSISEKEEIPKYEDISVETIEISGNDSTLQKIDCKDISEIVVILKEELEKEQNQKSDNDSKELQEIQNKQNVIPNPEEHFELIAQKFNKKEVKFTDNIFIAQNSDHKMRKKNENKPARKSIIPRIKPKTPDSGSLNNKSTKNQEMSLGKISKVPRFNIDYEEKSTMAKKPFMKISRSTRMSILKTTLNSSARRDSLRNLDNSIIKISSKKSTARYSIAPSSSGRKSFSLVQTSSRKSVVPSKAPIRKSIFVSSTKTATLPLHNKPALPLGKNNLPPTFATRKSVAQSSVMARKSIAPTTIAVKANPLQNINSRKSVAPSTLNSRKSVAHTVPKDDVSTKTFICKVCSRKFLVESLFIAHQKSHDKATKQNIADNKTCKYCDKKFAIEKALKTHLLEKCPKIPTADKKKLLFPDLNKPKKVTIPNTSASASILSSSESLSSTGNKTVISAIEKEMMPPSVTKVKKSSAHSGIYRTPTKRIECKICKLFFDSCLEFTEHCLCHNGDSTKHGLGNSSNGFSKGL